MKLKPMVWESRNSLLSISHVMGLVYCIMETSLEITCGVAGVVLYKGDNLEDAKQAAQRDAASRVLELIE